MELNIFFSLFNISVILPDMHNVYLVCALITDNYKLMLLLKKMSGRETNSKEKKICFNSQREDLTRKSFKDTKMVDVRERNSD